MFIRAANICARTTLPVSNEVQTRTLSTSWVTATGILLVCRPEHSPIKQIDYDDSEESACKSGQFNLLCCSNIRQEPLNFIIAGLQIRERFFLPFNYGANSRYPSVRR